MLFSKNILKFHPISEIIYDVECTGHLTKLISKYMGRPLMWKTGPAFMKSKLSKTAAKLAGDRIGHFHFNDRWFAYDDALYAACRMLEILSSDTRSSSEIFAELPECIHASEFSIELAEGENQDIIATLNKESNFPGGVITDIDGLRVDYPESWALIRYAESSNSLEVRFEADTEAALTQIQNQFESLIFKKSASST
jgi:phosphomannomutase/phosphoglucomutase